MVWQPQSTHILHHQSEGLCEVHVCAFPLYHFPLASIKFEKDEKLKRYPPKAF